MKASKEELKESGYVPRLKLAEKQDGGGVKPLGKFKMKALKDKKFTGEDYHTGERVEKIKVLLEDEEGEHYMYDFPTRKKVDGKYTDELHYLVVAFSEVEKGDWITLEMKKKGKKNYVDVNKIDDEGNEAKVGEDEDPLSFVDENEDEE